ncbi:MAG: ribbon-helix-helix protein, CopG family [Oscillibacter sp.]|nr:ribbon-helix-helix protein, CopG family [Oscillibacter sp.]
MAVKSMIFKLDELDIDALAEVAAACQMSFADAVKEAVREYIEKKRADPLYRLTANVKDADQEEAEEILAVIENMPEADRAVVSSQRFTA